MTAQPVLTPTEVGILDSLGTAVVQDLGVVAVAIVIAYVLSALLTIGATRLTARTESRLDDAVIAELRPAIFFGLLALAVWIALGYVEMRAHVEYFVMGGLGTAVAVVGGRSVFRSVILVIREYGRPTRTRRRISPRLIPLLEYTAQIGLWLVVLHAILVAWDVEAVLLKTMSGTLGFAVGLAAEGSLSNIIAGMFLHADRSCQIGDCLQLEDGSRGLVRQVGLRSIRVLTEDHVEINIPNALLGAGRVVNESAGEGPDARLRTEFVVALGTDVDLVRRVVGEMPTLPFLAPDHPSEFRVLGFEDRGIRVAVYFWVVDLLRRTPARDAVNTWLYRRLTAAGVSFALVSHVVHVDGRAMQAALGRAGPL